MRWAVVTALWVSLTGCGAFDESTPQPLPGKVCYDDVDCAPDACCGKGTAVVHVSDAPDCSMVSCDGTCPVNGVRCGCAVPVCRDSRCTSAISPTPGC